MASKRKKAVKEVAANEPVEVRDTNGALRYVVCGLARVGKLETQWPTTQRIGKIRRGLAAAIEDFNGQTEKIGNAYCVKKDQEGFVRSMELDTGIIVRLIAAKETDQKKVDDLWTDLLKQEFTVTSARLGPDDWKPAPGRAPFSVSDETLTFLGPFYDWQDGLDARVKEADGKGKPESEE